MFRRCTPSAIVVHSTEINGISAIRKAMEISTFMNRSLRLRAWVKERVGLNLSKSMTGAPFIEPCAAGAAFGVCTASVITHLPYR